ncbi:aerobic respiration two-component sensor histidine kinase ArcB [Limnobaculum zhutongyuii]|uniref:Aerobic respiration control sensor protein n=1 Tax=Limnobaculum zhutongyuii TaxID=2498113 RepID=A0A411WNM5_9GAMM|nr:aerobic respiration two-component sensor histidine kinase ArcB [Limnobaculum zhutongyuii]QBH97778.1 aerobic respiration two-component sensor histidine kinase ArcB [Limnobaculum zhutongyuii]TQS87931.1 aerobic respiration two-component sensor histidine kinase ArcB [Limnobaculum zhutongyuii]
MKQLRKLAQYYVDAMVKLGLVRFSLILASIIIVLAFTVQISVTAALHGEIERIDVIRSIFFGLLVTPWAVYFLSIVVEQLEDSRQRLAKLVETLEDMRARDLELNHKLQNNIERLNQEIGERIKAEEARERAIEELQIEIAQRQQAQIEYEQQSVFLRSFLDSSPDLVYYRDEEGRFSGCNRAMELLTGRSEKQLIGLSPDDIYNSEVAEKVIETDDKVFRHNVSLTYEQWLVYPDGRKACFEVRKVPFYALDGKRHGLMGFGRDITERKRYQDALEKASRDKTTFISTISHELRTPLNGIVGLSRILLDTDLNAEQLKYLRTIYVSATTLGYIFNDVIELDKIERRKTQLEIAPLDLLNFLSDLENLSGLLVEPKGLSFTLEYGDNLPAFIMTDGTRLRQILWNLIGNAVKFTSQGGVTIRARREGENHFYFEVEDSGIGIPQEEIDKIFAMYYQVASKHGGRPATGTGIGLAVSLRLAQAMGGDIFVKSEVGKGTVFTVFIKASVAEKEAPQKEELPSASLRVLLVEDIELNVIVARSVLEKLGHTVSVAMTGTEALEKFKPGAFDLLLLDIQLPDMTGFDIARQIRTHYAPEEIPPLVALTANVLKDKQEYLNSGMDDVLSKPLSVPELMVVIKKIGSAQLKMLPKLQEQGAMKPNESILDLTMLEQYMELVGPQLILDGLTMYEQVMPGYLAVLESNMTAKDEKGITEEAHKIKGASGSVGLKHLQQLARQIQTPTLPAWWDNVEEWIDELKLEWRNDVQVLRTWVEAQEKR